jgi:hypothetical protein
MQELNTARCRQCGIEESRETSDRHEGHGCVSHSDCSERDGWRIWKEREEVEKGVGAEVEGEQVPEG